MGALVLGVLHRIFEMHFPGMFFMGVIFCIPCAADVFIQRYTAYTSSNSKRIITGLLAGMGIFTAVICAAEKLGF